MITTTTTYRLCQASGFRTLMMAVTASSALLLATVGAGPVTQAEAAPKLGGIIWHAPLPLPPSAPSLNPALPDLPLPPRRHPIRREPIVKLVPLSAKTATPISAIQETDSSVSGQVPPSWAAYGMPLSMAELKQYDGGVGPLGVGLLVGAVGGAAGYGVEAYLEGRWDWSEFGSSVLSGAAAGMTAGSLAGGGGWLGAARNIAGSVARKIVDWAWPF